MKQYVILYLATLAIMAVLDLTWIGAVAKDFYKSRMGSLMEIHAVPAVLFYLMYIGGILIFVNGTPGAPWQATMLYGALFGFFCYATYDMTNLATIRDWSLSLVIVDMAWGTLVTAIASTGGRFVTDYFIRS